MRNGKIIPGSLPPLTEIRELAQQNLQALPIQYRALTVEKPYPVRFSEGLQALRKQVVEAMGNTLSP
jgi:nicotinate phosphoribosyltransferase